MKIRPILLTQLYGLAGYPWLCPAMPVRASANHMELNSTDMTEEAFSMPQVLSFRDALLSLLPGVPSTTGDITMNSPSEILFHNPGSLGESLDQDPDMEVQHDIDQDVMHEMGYGGEDEQEEMHKYKRQDSGSGSGEGGDAEVLYLCSAPDFDTSCGDACLCLSLPVSTAPIAYGGKPPCAPIPDSLRPGPPQGVSSARAYSKWECVLFADVNCDDTEPDNMFPIIPGESGNITLGVFDDKAQSYRCGKLE